MYRYVHVYAYLWSPTLLIYIYIYCKKKKKNNNRCTAHKTLVDEESIRHSVRASVLLLLICISSSSSCHAASTDIPDPLSPLLPIVHRLW